jgi:XRE family aerobic/anaerobic benzoate catabolism transcriptional regulator
MAGRADTSVIEGIGANVRRLRERSGMTARQAAQRSGLSPRFYSLLEAGRANIAVGRLAAVAEALGVSLAELVARGRVERRAARPRPIALLGLRGSGKSTVGRKLASDLRVPFVELDDRIEERAGLALPEIFAFHGEPYYRKIEGECVEALLREGRPCVVALSGGIVHNERAFALVRRGCLTIWLRARPEDHMRRVLEQGDRRPMANRINAMAELRAILDSRRRLYRRADAIVDTSRRTAAQVAHAAAAAARRKGWAKK